MFIQHASFEAAPPSFERPIDLVHLARQTLGDRALEREILGLFMTQARALVAKLEMAPAGKSRLDLAHTLKGSARAVGAWRVAEQAERCETECEACETAWTAKLGALGSAVAEACGAISEVHLRH